MSMWVQQCPECGYCAFDVSDTTANAANIMASVSYKQIRFHDGFPELAKPFLMLALLQEDSNRQLAANARLHAAWVCDDAGFDSLASDCRALAINDMASLMPFADTEDTQTATAAMTSPIAPAASQFIAEVLLIPC